MENTKRLDYLDSLRGIAAIVVVISHFALMVPEATRDSINSVSAGLQSLPNFGIYTLQKIHMAARSSVILFFVLSGFVLTRSLVSKHTPHYAYMLKRFFRIYPVLFAIMLISYGLHQAIGFKHPVPSEWLASVCDIDLSIKTLLKNLLLWGTTNSNALDGAAWSLAHELRISFFFPLILWTVQRGRSAAVLGWLLVSIGCTVWMHNVHGHFIMGFREDSVALSWIGTLFFVPFFAAGAWLSLNHEVISARLQRLPGWLIALLALSSAYCILKSDGAGLAAGGADYLRGLGSSGLIALAISFARFERILSQRAPVWTGRISYSLYLIHMPIIYLVVELPDVTPPLPVISAAVLILSLVAAEILARTVEFPFNRLGKFLARRLINHTRESEVIA